MTDQPRCDLCTHPIHDQAYVCATCADHLHHNLATVARIAGETWTTITRTDNTTDGGRRTDTHMPLPINLTAAQEHDTAVLVLTGWARRIADERGITMPGRRAA